MDFEGEQGGLFKDSIHFATIFDTLKTLRVWALERWTRPMTLAFLMLITTMPIFVKGVLTAEDTRLAIQAGAAVSLSPTMELVSLITFQLQSVHWKRLSKPHRAVFLSFSTVALAEELMCSRL
ncbi:hypothetical protein C4D60_Mb04t30090 [Musa balbisiana]|uniref:Uncharacterized protein n=1 Tax=Musa balbisiana TaxID=52838 RepID=A0A4S8KFU6_MUSBA|nr:hypothetical protein C4D60_Mb04t30090 [Musa balbisiana]